MRLSKNLSIDYPVPEAVSGGKRPGSYRSRLGFSVLAKHHPRINLNDNSESNKRCIKM